MYEPVFTGVSIQLNVTDEGDYEVTARNLTMKRTRVIPRSMPNELPDESYGRFEATILDLRAELATASEETLSLSTLTLRNGE